MQRIILNVVVATLAFASGVISNTSRQYVVPLRYCEVARNALSYNGKTVRVRATLIFGSDAMYVFEDCDPISALASLVELEGSQQGLLKRTYVEEVLVSGSQEKISKVDAIITGRFDGKYSNGCWRPAFRIAATKIEFISPVTKYEPLASDSSSRTRH